ncbi:unnamed protein product [Timema podura]|uniref:Uncharacterized protein n=1 Tax=Timema podura TaxID=61482 RepID=A0ABN7NQ51_TIMPD|nr:unnamed protein product [Timema podura]
MSSQFDDVFSPLSKPKMEGQFNIVHDDESSLDISSPRDVNSPMTHCFTENLEVSGIEPRNSGSVARNSDDHYTKEILLSGGFQQSSISTGSRNMRWCEPRWEIRVLRADVWDQRGSWSWMGKGLFWCEVA